MQLYNRVSGLHSCLQSKGRIPNPPSKLLQWLEAGVACESTLLHLGTAQLGDAPQNVQPQLPAQQHSGQGGGSVSAQGAYLTLQVPGNAHFQPITVR
jgi:hypothetical protein